MAHIFVNVHRREAVRRLLALSHKREVGSESVYKFTAYQTTPNMFVVVGHESASMAGRTLLNSITLLRIEEISWRVSILARC